MPFVDRPRPSYDRAYSLLLELFLFAANFIQCVSQCGQLIASRVLVYRWDFHQGWGQYKANVQKVLCTVLAPPRLLFGRNISRPFFDMNRNGSCRCLEHCLTAHYNLVSKLFYAFQVLQAYHITLTGKAQTCGGSRGRRTYMTERKKLLSGMIK